MMQLKIDSGTYRQLMHNLQIFPRKVMFKHLRIALNAWGGVVRDRMRSLAPKESGLLRQSLSVKVKIPDASYNTAHHGKPGYVVVGPKRGLVRAVTRTKKGFRQKSAKGIAKAHEKGLSVQIRRPSRYAHLLERGTSRGVRAVPFVRRSQNYGATTGMDKLFNKLRDGIKQETAALSK